MLRRSLIGDVTATAVAGGELPVGAGLLPFRLLLARLGQLLRCHLRRLWAKEGHRPAEVEALDRQLTYWAHVYDRDADEIVDNWYDVKGAAG